MATRMRREAQPKPHPSGRPYQLDRRGVTNYARPPHEGYLIPRLNLRQLAGGFGFPVRRPAQDDDADPDAS